MPCVCIKEGRKPTKHRIEDIELSSSVSFLKKKAAEKLEIPVEEQSKYAFGITHSRFLRLVVAKLSRVRVRKLRFILQLSDQYKARNQFYFAIAIFGLSIIN